MKKKQSLLSLAIMTFPQYPKEKLLSFILCGDLKIGNEWCKNPKALFDSDFELKLRPGLEQNLSTQGFGIPPKPYVSRAGYKLEEAFDVWGVKVSGRVWLDAGSSTGGFTHLLLLRGAETVHSVDVGYNILDYRLRRLKQVVVHERCNIMELQIKDLQPKPQAAVADLSFRSIEGAASCLFNLVGDGEVFALLKPQFERKYLEKKDVSFTGVLPEEQSEEVLLDLARRLAQEGVVLKALLPAGIRGRKGNLEYCAWLEKPLRQAEDELKLSDNHSVSFLEATSKKIIKKLFLTKT